MDRETQINDETLDRLLNAADTPSSNDQFKAQLLSDFEAEIGRARSGSRARLFSWSGFWSPSQLFASLRAGPGGLGGALTHKLAPKLATKLAPKFAPVAAACATVFLAVSGFSTGAATANASNDAELYAYADETVTAFLDSGSSVVLEDLWAED
ncbi:MAG: hypothetical protein AAF850_03335 [Pseudomonadota bacterium]